MSPLELIALARALVNGVITGGAAPVSQTELRRAVSCAYYAMFHTLAASNANALRSITGGSTALGLAANLPRRRSSPYPEQAQSRQPRQPVSDPHPKLR